MLVTFALESEFVAWRRLRNFARVENAAIPTFESTRNGFEIRVVLTGMGSARAQRVAREALHWQPDICVAAGFAGGLKPEYRSGCVLVAEAVRDAETNRSLASDHRIIQLAEESGASRVPALITCSYALAKVEDKIRMGQAADAVDMESFHILEAAHERGIVGIAIRAVSDAVDEDLPFDFSQILDDRGRVRILRLAQMVIVSPLRIPGLIRLGLASRRAAARLAQVLEETIGLLGQNSEALAEAAVEPATA